MENHPAIFGDAAPCRINGAKNFSDQCAINLGVALRQVKPSQNSGLHAVKKIKPKDFEDDLEGQQGIIFFKDFWRRGNETVGNRSGDHIDLWNGRRLTDWLSYPRIQ